MQVTAMPPALDRPRLLGLQLLALEAGDVAVVIGDVTVGETVHQDAIEHFVFPGLGRLFTFKVRGGKALFAFALRSGLRRHFFGTKSSFTFCKSQGSFEENTKIWSNFLGAMAFCSFLLQQLPNYTSTKEASGSCAGGSNPTNPAASRHPPRGHRSSCNKHVKPCQAMLNALPRFLSLLWLLMIETFRNLKKSQENTDMLLGTQVEWRRHGAACHMRLLSRKSFSPQKTPTIMLLPKGQKEKNPTVLDKLHFPCTETIHETITCSCFSWLFNEKTLRCQRKSQAPPIRN